MATQTKSGQDGKRGSISNPFTIFGRPPTLGSGGRLPAGDQFHWCPPVPTVINSGVLREDSIPTRASLLRRLKDLDDAASWDEFYQTYRRLIFSVARRAGLNEAEAEEVVQDTVVAVARKMPGFTYEPGKDSFKGWLLTITRWRMLDQFKKRRSMRIQSQQTSAAMEEGTRTETIERIPDPTGPALTAIWDEEWGKNLLHTALGRIKRQVHPQQYEIYHLHVILEKPVREVARTLGVSAGRVYLAKHRVGALLKKELKKLEQSL